MQNFECNPYALQTHLDCLYDSHPRKFSFQAASLAEFEQWRSAFREELKSILGIHNRTPKIESVNLIQSIDRGSYMEEHHAMQVEKKALVPFYLLIPKNDPPYRTVLVFHGHDSSANWCMGIYLDEKTRQQNLSTDNNYAQALVEAGYMVCVVEQRGMSSRLTHQRNKSDNSCRHLAFSYLLHGYTLLGERILDGISVLSWLHSRSDIAGSIGCTGHSAGGATALWLSALDDRIGTAVVSGYFNSFKGSILAMEHCECNYVPGILSLGEMGDLAALIAPRPLCLLNGEQDAIFPVEHARTEFKTVQEAYALVEQPDAAVISIHSGGHFYNNKISIDWFSKWLPITRAIS